ncbi:MULTISPECIES: NlpC/P60 family protein [Streptomyces]|uniref:C40 family peptidase n=1 Tax=Streptomyces siderophoricus TaxID=2802281 RepID=A0ABS1MS00_9ACTN|nr:NlpC/P60 family protein [Streptomyces sp. 9-7]MBL1090538.1 C40 family peptidase [Streptomyces sp. 9-7]
MAASSPRTKRLSVAALAVLALTSTALTYQLHRTPAGHADPAASAPLPSHPDAGAASYTYDRLSGPARTVVRDATGGVAATLTDGARTAVLTGPSRTFTEPHTTKAKIVTDSWVRLMPKPWKAGTEKEKWFTDWFAAFHHSTRPDLLAISLQYVKGAPRKKDRQGLRYAGPATFGPPDPHGSPAGGPHRRPSDFYHYLGRPWTFPDRKNVLPDKSRYGSVDSSGYVRLVYGYRGGYALLGTDRVGPGLPRTANGIASVGPGVPVIPHRGARPSELDTLQPGDLLFFDTDRQNGPRLDHMGIYLGLDTDGHPRFLSSRERNNGPTFGDAGGSSRIDGAGIYANSLREAKRL